MKANGDLRVAELLLANEGFVATAMFHVQQAVEKVLKAVLVHHGVPFEKTHDLRLLKQQVVTVEAALGVSLDGIEDLTVFAWRFRYPGSPEEPSLDEAHDNLELARRTMGAALDVLPPEVHP
ncbi:MAG: HEPN domain-containing protein [Solirubrobacteraceae bacterium]